jgi:hypothetical protein
MLKRRVEMLDAVSTGLHPSVVVAQLASKYGISERALWSDWGRRARWVPFVLSLGKFAGFAEEVGQKLDAVQRAAWSLYLKASNDSARVGALRTVLEALGLHSELVQMREVAERLEKLEDAVKKQSSAKRFG